MYYVRLTRSLNRKNWIEGVTPTFDGTPEDDVDFATGYFPYGRCAFPFVV